MHGPRWEDPHEGMRVGRCQVPLQPCDKKSTEVEGACCITIDDEDALGRGRREALVEAKSGWAVFMMRKDRIV